VLLAPFRVEICVGMLVVDAERKLFFSLPPPPLLPLPHPVVIVNVVHFKQAQPYTPGGGGGGDGDVSQHRWTSRVEIIHPSYRGRREGIYRRL